MKTLTSKQTHFEVLEMAGEGLNSRVYKAFRRDITGSIKQLVALKILKSKDDVSFWRQEADSLLRVKSPYCVQVYDFVWVDQQPALVLEWLEGATLAELFRSTALSKEESTEILLQTQEGLVDLHLANLCHGDLHMGNIFVTTEGQVKLIDFGWANVSRVHEQGAPEARAPELEHGATPGLWTDLFSLGRIAAHLEHLIPSLLAARPQDRDLMPGRRSPLIQTQIAKKVSELLLRRRISKSQATEALARQKPEKSSSSIILSFCFPLFGLFLSHSSAVPSSFAAPVASNISCTLEVRTRHWHEIEVHGRKKFSPAQIELNACDGVRIAWRNQKGSGKLNLRLEPGERRRLTDKDFTLDRTQSY